VSTSSHCPSWCDRPSRRHAFHSTTLGEHVGDNGATVTVRVVAHRNDHDRPNSGNKRPNIQLKISRPSGQRVGFHGGLELDAESANILAETYDATGAPDVARALRDACAVLEDAS
jgi:hypothetical protein